MKKEIKELLNDVAIQMRTFGRPSEENVKSMMRAIESLSSDLKEQEQEAAEFLAKLKVTEKELQNAQDERDACMKIIYEAKGIVDEIRGGFNK